MKTDKLIQDVNLAILANGGPGYDKKACECDASVGNAPCRYCAMRDVLNSVLKYLKDAKVAEQTRRILDENRKPKMVRSAVR